jgi:hypothetical protein
MYNQSRLEWHLGERGESLNPTDICAVLSDDKRTFDSPQSLVVALAKSQDRREICRVFAFGQRNAVRQWLRLRYPDTRQARLGNVGLVLERGGEIVWDSAIAMTWLRKASIEAQANFGFDHGKAVLCSNNHQKAIRERR